MEYNNPQLGRALEQIYSVADTSWFLTKPQVEGSDGVWTAKKLFSDKQIAAVLVSRTNSILPPYTGDNLNVIANPARSTFTITFTNKEGEPAYATFNSRRHTFDLLLLS